MCTVCVFVCRYCIFVCVSVFSVGVLYVWVGRFDGLCAVLVALVLMQLFIYRDMEMV